MQLVLLELGILALMVLLNGMLAMVEIAVVSSNRSRLREWGRDGNHRAQAALALVESPAVFLSTVQLGVTLVGIFAGAYGGVTLAGILGRSLAEVSWLAPVAGPLAVVLVGLGITLCMLIFGELVPKQAGLSRPEQIACAAARPMHELSRLAGPLVRTLAAVTDGIVKLLRLHPRQPIHVSEEEVKLLVREGQRAGALLPEETRMVERVLDFDQLTVRDLMQPRGDMIWLDLDRPEEQQRQVILDSGHSRFPVFRERRDNLLGVVSIKDLHEQAVAGRPFDLQPLLRQPLLVPPTQSAIVLLRSFQGGGANFALVVDEFGGVAGLVTLHDVMRAIVGELPDEEAERRPEAVHEADGSWGIDALIRLADLADELPGLPLETTTGPAMLTLNGFLVRHCDRIPQAGESITLGNYRIEITDRDSSRVLRVRVTELGDESTQP